MMNPQINLFSKSLLFFIATALYAQTNVPLLSLSDALDLGAKANTTYQRVHSANVMAQNDVTTARTTLLPTLAYTSNLNTVGPNFKGEPDLNPATHTAYNTWFTNTIGATWTLFDGLGSWNNLSSRKTTQSAVETHGDYLTSQIHAQIMLAYYDISRQQSILHLRHESLNFSDERLTIAKSNHNIGAASLLNEQQAILDRNADSTAMLVQILNAAQSHRQLNWLLARDAETAFSVDSVIPVDSSLQRDDLWAKTLEHSQPLAEARLRAQAASLDYHTALGSVLPTVQAFANYEFLNQYGDPAVGAPSTSINNQGLIVGVTLTMPLFEGGKSVAKVSNAHEAQVLADIQVQETTQQLARDFAQAFAAYQQSIETLKLQEDNFAVAESTLALAMGQFRIGALSTLDLRSIQVSQQAAGNALYTARFDAKNTEIAVKLLAGIL